MTVVAGGIVQSVDLTALALLTTGRPLVRLIQQSTQNFTTGNNLVLAWSGSEDTDTHNFHDPSTNNSRVTPTLAGYYLVTGTVAFSGNGNVTAASAAIVKNAASTIQPFMRVKPGTSTAAFSVQTRCQVQFNGTGDYIELWGNATFASGTLSTQASGGINSVLELEYLRPL